MTPGSVVWFELGTTNLDATTAFYQGALGLALREGRQRKGQKPYYNVCTGGDRPAGSLHDHSGDAPEADCAMPSIFRQGSSASTPAPTSTPR
ncbi:hypothetical protein GTW71_36780 [Streptomyces sp. SID6041]|nr:hypothetical protein [Streptomyces sp. SID6041]